MSVNVSDDSRNENIDLSKFESVTSGHLIDLMGIEMKILIYRNLSQKRLAI